MAPKLVAPYRMSGKRGKNDAADAAAICEAVQRPGRFTVVKSPGLHELKDKKNFVARADLLNRPVRTRTVGGVGAGARNPWLPDFPAWGWAASWCNSPIPRCRQFRRYLPSRWV